MSMFTHSCHLLFDHFQFALIHGPDIPGSYAILLFIALDLASITSHIHSWVLFLLWLHPFILSRVISPLISSSILGTYRPGEFLFQYPIILPFHTVHGVLKARILKWFAIPFSSGPPSVRPLHRDIRTRPSFPFSPSLRSGSLLSLMSEGKQNENHSQRKLIKLITWTTALSNSVKLRHAMWGHPRRAGHGGEV